MCSKLQSPFSHDTKARLQAILRAGHVAWKVLKAILAAALFRVLFKQVGGIE